MESTRLPTCFLNHGAGPWLWLVEIVRPMNSSGYRSGVGVAARFQAGSLHDEQR